MIKNERQYRITRIQAEKFAHALEKLKAEDRGHGDVHPLLLKAQEEALQSQLTDLQAELKEYERLQAGDFEFQELLLSTELPRALIRARIAKGWSQKDLAQRLGLKEQQVQRYEATEYESASMSRVLEVVKALSVERAENEVRGDGRRG